MCVGVYLQTALSREQELENKLASMQGVLTVAKELASDNMIVNIPHHLLTFHFLLSILSSLIFFRQNI